MGFRRQREAFWTGFKSLSAAGRPLAASLWPVRSLPPLFLWASEGNVSHFDRLQKPLGSRQASCGLSVACPKPASSLLMGFRGNVRHFGPASKASRQPAGLLRPLCGLSEACLLSSYGLPKATLGILARLQTLPRASPLPCPLLGSWQACLFSSYGLPKATLGILARLQTLPEPHRSLALFSAGFRRRRLHILDRLQKLFGLLRPVSVACPKLLGSRQASCGLSVACPKPASSLLMGFRRQR